MRGQSGLHGYPAEDGTVFLRTFIEIVWTAGGIRRGPARVWGQQALRDGCLSVG